MARALRWEWSMMRNESVSPRTLLGPMTPGVSDSDWDFAYRKLVRLQKYVFELHAKRTNKLIEVSGNVASEHIKEVVEEVLRDYDPDAELSNLILVTAPFRSAEDGDDYVEFKGKIATDSAIAVKTVPVDRYPAFTFEELPSVGERFRFEVDLSGAANGREPIRFDLPSGWTIIAVDVDVISAQLRFAEGANRRKIVLESDGNSIAARFDAEVICVTDAGNVDVKVIFNCMGRYSGTSDGSFKAAKRAPIVQTG